MLPHIATVATQRNTHISTSQGFSARSALSRLLHEEEYKNSKTWQREATQTENSKTVTEIATCCCWLVGSAYTPPPGYS
ncbi:hypothetical protein E2C01_085424 [Portunus trituberculatus]|uniref:Uncharacterized protein n=1 Tax=Portunus trituberculatus TaxID=210409 RepID=A0A5B7J8U5_PORTR|nr:hypothetical protein [Portunus trituberculatus]